jgi:hypothetical protein
MIEKISYVYITFAILLFSSYFAIVNKNGSASDFGAKTIMSCWSLISSIAFLVIFGITSAIESGVPPTPITLGVLLACLLTSCISSCIVYLAYL